jgi:trehalose 6-phosphate synthase
VLIKRHHNHEEINQFYKIANFCLVTSLHDGMNLVAKEFVASRVDEKGVLILSQFTGAAQDLKEALIINPYDGEQTSEAIKTALSMPINEQTRRMKKLRMAVRNYNIYRWSAEFLRSMVNIE